MNIQSIKPRARNDKAFLPFNGAQWVVECKTHSALGATFEEAYRKWQTKFVEAQVKRG
jgi:hypothetical protein